MLRYKILNIATLNKNKTELLINQNLFLQTKLCIMPKSCNGLKK